MLATYVREPVPLPGCTRWEALTTAARSAKEEARLPPRVRGGISSSTPALPPIGSKSRSGGSDAIPVLTRNSSDVVLGSPQSPRKSMRRHSSGAGHKRRRGGDFGEEASETRRRHSSLTSEDDVDELFRPQPPGIPMRAKVPPSQMKLPSLVVVDKVAPKLRFAEKGKLERTKFGDEDAALKIVLRRCRERSWRLPAWWHKDSGETHQATEDHVAWMKSVSSMQAAGHLLGATSTRRVFKRRRASRVLSIAPAGSRTGSKAPKDDSWRDGGASRSLSRRASRAVEPEEQDASGPGPPGLIEVELSPTVASALERYNGAGEDAKELQRMHLVFRRFCMEGSSEVPRDRLHNALINLGIWRSTREEAEELAAGITSFAELDWVDFTDFVYKSQHCHCNAVRRAAEECLASGTASMDSVRSFLLSVGIVATEESAMYALKLAERDLESLTSVQDLLRLLAAFRVNEGFFPDEVAEAKQMFDGLARQPQHPAMAKASELSSGLLELEGLYCVDQLEALMDDFPSEEDNAPGVTFLEFLIWARRLRFLIMQERWETFNSNANPDGMVYAVELPNLANRLGFTLMSSVLEDLRQLHCETCGELMDFDGFLCFVDEVQSTHGFGEEEARDYEEVFHKFDHEENGELTSVQVIEVLRHLGYDIPAEEVHGLIKKVDFNGNGTMDIQEYMRLMRLLREKYISWVQRAFDKRRGSSPGLPSSSVFHFLNSLAEWPKGPMKELCANLPEVVNFETFLTLVDRCRAEGTVVSRKLAGFPDNITDPLLQIFKGPDFDAPRKFLPIGDLLWMLLDSSTVKVSTKEGRDRLLQQADAARAAAVDAGVGEDDLGQAGNSLGYYTFVHLIRAVVRDYELRALAAEQEATQALRLREAEIEEYRRLFASFRQDSNSSARRKSAVGLLVKETLSSLLTNVFRAQQVPQQAMLGMLKSLGQRTSAGQLEKLNTKMSTLNSNSDGYLDFATFVTVTHWLLQEKKLDIHTATEKLLGSSKLRRDSFA